MSKSGMAPEMQRRIERLKRLRKALDVPTQGAMASLLGIELGRWNHYERGMPIPAPIVQRICERFPGVDMDWIYYGEPRGLSFEMARRLGEFPAPSKDTTRKGR